MRVKLGSICAVAVLAVSVAVPVVFADTIEGEVVQVQNRIKTQTQNHGELHQIRVRTQTGEMLQLHLGEPGSCEDCVNVGDRVRVRTMNRGESDGPLRVRTMHNATTGNEFRFRNRGGELVQVQTRTRLHQRDGSRGGSGQAGHPERGGQQPDGGQQPGGGRGGRGGGGGRR